MERLFVYGTLKHDLACGYAERLVAQCLQAPEPARIPGRLYDLGPYPILVPARQSSEWVYGELVLLRNPVRCLPRLDHYEGYDPDAPERSEYHRLRARARRLVDDRAVSCWVYRFNGHPHGGTRLPDGVYRG